MPLNDEIGEWHLLARLWVAGGECLQRDAAAELFKMAFEVSLLTGHAVGAADAGADGADVLEILIGPVAVEGDVGLFELRHGGSLLGLGRAVVVEGQSDDGDEAEAGEGDV